MHLWGPASLEAGGVHFIVRDASGLGLLGRAHGGACGQRLFTVAAVDRLGLAVEFMEEAVRLYDDANDGASGVGLF